MPVPPARFDAPLGSEDTGDAISCVPPAGSYSQYVKTKQQMTRGTCPAPLAYRPTQVICCLCLARGTNQIARSGVSVILIEKPRQNRVGIPVIFAKKTKIVFRAGKTLNFCRVEGSFFRSERPSEKDPTHILWGEFASGAVSCELTEAQSRNT